MAAVSPVRNNEAVYCNACDRWVLETNLSDGGTQYMLPGGGEWYSEDELASRETNICPACGDTDGDGDDRYQQNDSPMIRCTNCEYIYDISEMDEARNCC